MVEAGTTGAGAAKQQAKRSYGQGAGVGVAAVVVVVVVAVVVVFGAGAVAVVVDVVVAVAHTDGGAITWQTRAPRTTNGLYKSADDDAIARKSSSMCARRTQSQVPLALPLATITRTVARWLAFAVRNSYPHTTMPRPLHATVRCPRCRNPTLSLGYGPLGLPGLLSH